jgi:hypothetical protein
MALPLTIQVSLQDGQVMQIKLPVETWLQGAVHTLQIATNQAVKSVILDPENKLPDSNRQNNVWKG